MEYQNNGYRYRRLTLRVERWELKSGTEVIGVIEVVVIPHIYRV